MRLLQHIPPARGLPALCRLLPWCQARLIQFTQRLVVISKDAKRGALQGRHSACARLGGWTRPRYGRWQAAGLGSSACALRNREEGQETTPSWV